MAGSFNQITIVGNLTRDPETKTVGTSSVCNISLAVNRNLGKNAPEGAQSVDYFRVNAWDKLGETCQTYLKKGMSCLISGKMQIRDYTDKDGNKRQSAEIVANQMQMLGTKGQSEGGSDMTDHATTSAPAAASHAGGPAEEDEIPF